MKVNLYKRIQEMLINSIGLLRVQRTSFLRKIPNPRDIKGFRLFLEKSKSNTGGSLQKSLFCPTRNIAL
jgi:hypothetical protein